MRPPRLPFRHSGTVFIGKMYHNIYTTVFQGCDWLLNGYSKRICLMISICRNPVFARDTGLALAAGAVRVAEWNAELFHGVFYAKVLLADVFVFALRLDSAGGATLNTGTALPVVGGRTVLERMSVGTG